MYGYLCTYSVTGERLAVHTNDGAYAAQQEAERHFAAKHPRRKIKAGQVTATLVELPDGSDYVHTAVN